MKALKRIFNIAVIVLVIWFVLSWFEIAFHSPLKPIDYSECNLIVPIFQYLL